MHFKLHVRHKYFFTFFWNRGRDCKCYVFWCDKAGGGVKEEAVTSIKMDIESAELEALKGAKQTITRDKPDLAIYIYHKDEDILEIPKHILE